MLQTELRPGIPRLLLLLGLAGLTAGDLRPQPVPDPPLIITGRLVDERGVPAVEVAVILRPYPSEYAVDLERLGGRSTLPQAVDQTRSGFDGSFSVAAPAIGLYRLEFHQDRPASGPAPSGPLVYRAILPLTLPLHLKPIELPDRHPLTVRVLDPDGRGIDGAFVYAYPTAQQVRTSLSREDDEEPERQLVELEAASARTDENGLAQFLMPARKAIVTVSAPGFAFRTSATSGPAATFRLDPTPGMTLRVRTPTGEPANRATVRTGGARPVPLGLTDEQGNAVIGVAAGRPGVFDVESASGAFASSLKPSVVSSQSAIVEVELQPAAAIPGRISSAATGRVLPDAVVWVQSDPGRRTTTDGAGRFELTAPLPSGSHDVGVVANGHISAAARVTTELLDASDSVSIGLVPAAPFAGQVLDNSQQPLVGANVHLEPTGMGRFVGARQRRSARTTSGPDGSFYIDNALYDRAYRLTVDAPGFASVQQELRARRRNSPTTPIRIVLSKGRQPWGTVVDVERTPVAGAQVHLFWPSDNPEVGNSYGSEEASPSVTSNNRGEFEFPLVAPGPYDLHILHPEHLDLQAETVSVPQGGGYFDLGVFALAPGSEIHGIVVDPNDNPVKGAEVSLRQRTQGLSRQRRAAITDGEGRFRLGGLAPVPTDVTTIADGLAPTLVESVRPAAGEPITIEMTKGASLAGWVVEPDGTPAAGIEVALTLLPADVPRVAQSVLGQDLFRRGRTDEDGRFRFDNVVPARWTAEARDDTSVATQEGVELTQGELREVQLRLNAPDRLTVFVTNDLGEPVSNAEIRASPKDRSRKSAFGHSDAAGRSTLWVSPGPATVAVEHPELLNRSREVVIEPGASELHVQLGTGWEIRGTVRSIDGVPISGATVEAIRQLPGEVGENGTPNVLRRFHRMLEPPARDLTDLSGGFRLAGLARGRYRLVARLAGFTEGESPNTIEINDQALADIELVLEPGASNHGFVSGLDSIALASAEVQAWQGVLFRTAKPDVDGGFELTAVGPGTWQLAVTTGQRRSAMRDVTLKAGDPAATVELRFELGLRLAGQVLVNGRPATGGFVSALLDGGHGPRRTRTDHEGRFEMHGLQAGTYKLEFRHMLGVKQAQQVDLQSDYHNMLVNLQPRHEPPN